MQMFDNSKIYLAGDPALLMLGRPSTLAHWRSEGRGPPYIKLGSRVGYQGHHLNEWMAAQTVWPTDGLTGEVTNRRTTGSDPR